MKIILSFLMTIALFASGCEKIEDCPDCIKSKVKEFAKTKACNDGSAGVAEYIFQDKYVYVFSDGTCGPDLGAAVYTDKCEYLGYLGGFAGNNKINGIIFSDSAVFQRKIWHD